MPRRKKTTPTSQVPEAWRQLKARIPEERMELEGLDSNSARQTVPDARPVKWAHRTDKGGPIGAPCLVVRMSATGESWLWMPSWKWPGGEAPSAPKRWNGMPPGAA